MANLNACYNESSRFVYSFIKLKMIPPDPWPRFDRILSVISILNHLPSLNEDIQGDDSSMAATLNCDIQQRQKLSSILHNWLPMVMFRIGWTWIPSSIPPTNP